MTIIGSGSINRLSLVWMGPFVPLIFPKPPEGTTRTEHSIDQESDRIVFTFFKEGSD